MRPMQQVLISLAVFFFGLFVFTLGIASQDVIAFESRFYLFAQEMWRNGLSFFPTTYNQPYPDYTAASTAIIYFFATVLGGVTKFSAVLPSAICASLVLVVTYLIGTFQSIRYGLTAVLWLLLTFTFFKSARLIGLDIYPALITAICFYLVHSSTVLNQPKREKWIYLFLILGFIFRGPIGLVIPTGVVMVYYVLDQQWRKTINTGLGAAIILIVCSTVLIIMANYVGGMTFAHDVIRMQVLGRLQEKYRPIYFYFINSLGTYALSYVFACLISLGMLVRYLNSYLMGLSKRMTPKQHHIKERNHAVIIKYVGWMLIILIGMSIPGDKKTRYILPFAPALALIAASILENTPSYLQGLKKIFLVFAFFFPAYFIIAVLFLYSNLLHDASLFSFGMSTVLYVLCALQIVNIFVIVVLHKHAGNLGFFLLCTMVLTFVHVYITSIEPVMLSSERGKTFITEIEHKRSQVHAKLKFYKESPDGLAIKYMIDMPYASLPEFIQREEDILKAKGHVFFVTRKKYFLALPNKIKEKVSIVGQDQVGHVNVIVFTKKDHEGGG